MTAAADKATGRAEWRWKRPTDTGSSARSEGGVARLELVKPPRNLLDPDVMAALRDAILEADADAE